MARHNCYKEPPIHNHLGRLVRKERDRYSYLFLKVCNRFENETLSASAGFDSVPEHFCAHAQPLTRGVLNFVSQNLQFTGTPRSTLRPIG